MSDTKIQGAVDVQQKSTEHAALELTRLIASAERKGSSSYPEEQQTRAYWLKLYSETLKVVRTSNYPS
ncbi:MAG: hypothetical protein H7Z73_12330 [Candidatus Saccharibacteria bacterium]|nr:hypothetical protein [Moraxellaceae bacterium]